MYSFRSRVSLLAATVLLVACSETATAPTTAEGPTKGMKLPTVPKKLVSYGSGYTVSVQDEQTGVMYTLDAQSRRLTTSTGYQIILDEESSLTLYTHMLGIMATDAADQDLAGACSPETCGEISQTLLPQPDPEAPAISLDKKTFGFLPNEYTKKINDKNRDLATSFMSGTCSDIYIARYGNLIEFRESRTKGLGYIAAAAVSEGANLGVDKLLPPGILSGALIMTAIAEVVISNTRINFLQTWWNSYNCGDRNVTIGPVWVAFAGNGSTPPAPPPAGTDCDSTQARYATGSMTLDGVHWYAVTFKICTMQS